MRGDPKTHKHKEKKKQRIVKGTKVKTENEDKNREDIVFIGLETILASKTISSF